MTFREAGTVLGTTDLVPVGTEAIAYFPSNLASGVRTITATYNGDGNFSGSSSLTVATLFTEGANQVYVGLLYQELLRRQPDNGGFAFWTGALDRNELTRSR